MSENKYDVLILEKISEIGERTARMESEQSRMKEDIDKIIHQDVIQNNLLAEHIQGVQTAQARLDNEIKARELVYREHQLLKSRVGVLEEAPKFRATLRQYLIGIGAIAGSVVAIFKLLKYLGL